MLAWWLRSLLPAAQLLPLYVSLAVTGLLLTIALATLGVALELLLLRPLRSAAEAVQIIVHGNTAHEPELPTHHWLGGLPTRLRDVAVQLQRARTEVARALGSGARQAETEKNRLAGVLHELSEGVLVCDAQCRVLLYNAAASALLGGEHALGLGRSLYTVLARAPFEHALQRLREQQAAPRARDDIAFLCPSVERGALLRCRMRLLAHGGGDFVLTFTEASSETDALNRRDLLLHTVLTELAPPLRELRALALRAPLEAGHDGGCISQITRAAARADEILQRVQAERETLPAREWLHEELSSSDLICNAIRRLDGAPPEVTEIGLPCWLQVDSYSVSVALAQLLRRLHEFADVAAVDVEAGGDDVRAWLDIVWAGAPVPAQTLQAWTRETLPDAVAAHTLQQVAEHHGSTLESAALGRAGEARLRLTLPAAPQTHDARAARPPPRPEFYDFDIAAVDATSPLAERDLSTLDYVVFDTETTGLRPSDGDEIIAIAGVRIVNGRILSSESFECLVNPERPIPAASTRFHGIDDAMVADSPPASVVLARFHRFAAGAVLVAHNSAFDLRFLKLKERAAGVNFDHPVLDTLLMSVYLHGHATDHTLDGIAQRLGVHISDRHSALGDTLVTAEVFLRLLALAREHDLRTLGALAHACEQVVEIRKLQKQF